MKVKIYTNKLGIKEVWKQVKDGAQRLLENENDS